MVWLEVVAISMLISCFTLGVMRTSGWAVGGRLQVHV